jgi:uncharacterized membrane protein YhaH (DUF805 family)
MKPWMWILLLIAAVFLFFGFDPIGDLLVQNFGENAKKIAIDIIVILALIYVSICLALGR